MALEIRVRKAFQHKLQKLVDYLDAEWNSSVTDQFLSKLQSRVYRLSTQPYTGIPSSKVAGVRSVPVTKHNRLYYRVAGKYLVILLLHDTRLHPKKNRYD